MTFARSAWNACRNGRLMGDRPFSARRSEPFRLEFGGMAITPAFDRITHDPTVLSGRATLRGLRISVAHVVNLVANGMNPAQITAEHPDLEEEDVRQALAYAAAIAEDQVHPIPAVE